MMLMRVCWTVVILAGRGTRVVGLSLRTGRMRMRMRATRIEAFRSDMAVDDYS